jgi:hypothetical protein
MAAADQQAAQASLAAAIAREVLAAWQALLDVAQLRKTIPDLSAAVAALAHQYGNASAALAVHYYETERAAAAVSGKFTPVPAQPPSLEQVTEGVRWATKDLWTADYAPHVEPAQVLLQGAASTLALDTGRETLITAVHQDRKARGWARHVEPGACYFCVMLATRGMAYRSRQTAEFQAHAHCRCIPEPVFTAYEPPARVREWEALWRSSTRGKSGAEARRAFRAALEGRDLKPTKAQTAAARAPKAASGRAESHVRSELAALQKSHAALKASGANPIAEKWQADRIAKLRRDLGK